MISFFFIGLAAGFFVGLYLEEIINWAKNALERLKSAIRKAAVWIQRVPSGIKQFLYYIEHGQWMTTEITRPATPQEIQRLKDKMPADQYKDFTEDGTQIATVERAA